MPPKNSHHIVLLANLGGPQTLGDIPGFLFDLFMDRDIIPIPLEGTLRKPLAHVLANVRGRRVRDRYQAIGGGSPLVSITSRQAALLQSVLRSQDLSVDVLVAMRYGRPSIEEVLRKVPGEFRHLVVLPLFPQYCRATTGSIIKKISLTTTQLSYQLRCTMIKSFWDHPLYLRALKQEIHASLERMRSQDRGMPAIIFCAHSVPLSFEKRGDPYLFQVEQTAERLATLSNLENGSWTLGYQSQVGPMKWAGPPVEDLLYKMGREGQKSVLLVPLSFISDHLETLYDMDIHFREVARKAGITYFERARCLNDRELFITCLAELVMASLDGEYNLDDEARSSLS